MLTLLEKQQHFTAFVVRFLDDLYHRGYLVTFGEAYRPQQMAAIYAQSNMGILNSNHTIRLAIDLNIFYDGALLVTHDQLFIPGELWKAYSTDQIECCWGGDFKNPDCDHFSFMHNNTK